MSTYRNADTVTYDEIIKKVDAQMFAKYGDRTPTVDEAMEDIDAGLPASWALEEQIDPPSEK